LLSAFLGDFSVPTSQEKDNLTKKEVINLFFKIVKLGCFTLDDKIEENLYGSYQIDFGT